MNRIKTSRPRQSIVRRTPPLELGNGPRYIQAGRGGVHKVSLTLPAEGSTSDRGARSTTVNIEQKCHLGQKTTPRKRNVICLLNNPCRPSYTSVYPSMNHSPPSEGGANRREEGRVSDGGKSELGCIHQLYCRTQAETTPRVEDYLLQRDKARSRMSIETSQIS